MIIRAFSVDDYDAVVAVWDSVDNVHAQSRDAVMVKLSRDPELFLVAEEDGGRIVGVVMGTWDAHRAWIWRLAVVPDRQGDGVGRALITELERRLQELGAREVRMLVYADNPARGFWDEVGYEGHEGLVYYAKSLSE